MLTQLGLARLTFGFVSKYKKGAQVPDGQTEFQFRVAGLSFHSTSYDWLVVTGSDYAMFKGVGTINGAGEYEFRIWAGDGTPTRSGSRSGPRTTRAKRWCTTRAPIRPSAGAVLSLTPRRSRPAGIEDELRGVAHKGGFPHSKVAAAAYGSLRTAGLSR